MAGISDRAYSAACGKLATQLGISLAAARRKVDIQAAQQGLREAQALAHALGELAHRPLGRVGQADALEQLGYQSESATFRNAYLQGAQELRNGPVKLGGANARGKGILGAMTVEQIFDTVSVRLKSESVGGQSALVNWTFTDVNENWVLGLSNRTLFSVPGRHDSKATVTVTTSRTEFIRVMLQETTFMDQISAGNITLDGDPTALLTIFGNIDTFEPGFNIVEP